MRYCVIKGTTRPISVGNPDDILISNAISAGFTENEVDILTEEEYEARKALEPIIPQPPTEIELLKEKVATQDSVMTEILEGILPEIFGMLG